MNQNTLIRMANQIAHNMAAYPPDVAAVKVANHLGRYWEPRMLNDLFAYAKSENCKLEPIVLNALALNTIKH
jgi:formate dehydrogenase subunit delta